VLTDCHSLKLNIASVSDVAAGDTGCDIFTTGSAIQEEVIQHIVITFDLYTQGGSTLTSIIINKVKTDLGYQLMQGTWLDPPTSSSWGNDFNAAWVKSHKLELFGNKRATIDPANYAHWPGTIYMIAMYDRVLTAAEIAANYAAGSGIYSRLY
jgi:hypothetical protein